MSKKKKRNNGYNRPAVDTADTHRELIDDVIETDGTESTSDTEEIEEVFVAENETVESALNADSAESPSLEPAEGNGEVADAVEDNGETADTAAEELAENGEAVIDTAADDKVEATDAEQNIANSADTNADPFAEDVTENAENGEAAENTENGDAVEVSDTANENAESDADNAEIPSLEPTDGNDEVAIEVEDNGETADTAAEELAENGEAVIDTAADDKVEATDAEQNIANSADTNADPFAEDVTENAENGEAAENTENGEAVEVSDTANENTESNAADNADNAEIPSLEPTAGNGEVAIAVENNGETTDNAPEQTAEDGSPIITDGLSADSTAENTADEGNSEVSGDSTAADGENLPAVTEQGEDGTPVKKKKAPSKAALWCRKHVLLLTLLCLGLAIIGVCLGGHFYHTKDMLFIHSVEDIDKAENAGGILVFREDITYDGNLNLNNYNFDMNGHTFTVNGVLSMTADKETIGFGIRKKKAYEKGGTIVAQKITFDGGNTDVTLNADIIADDISLTTDQLTIGSTVKNAEETAKLSVQATKAVVCGKILGVANLSTATDYELYGVTTRINGGKAITVFDNGECSLITDSNAVTLYPAAKVTALQNVGSVLMLEKLNAPATLNVVENDGSYICYIGEVLNADGYTYTIGEITDTVTGTAFVLPALTPGDYTLSVTAFSNNSKYLASDAATVTVAYNIKLGAPTVAISADGNTLTITAANGVALPTSYEYTVNGTSYTYDIPADETTSVIDISAYTQEVGTYNVYVTAKHRDSHYTVSDKVLKTYVRKAVLATPVVTYEIYLTYTQFTVTWEPVEHADYYLVTYGDYTLYTKNAACSLDYAADTELTVTAIGSGYYINSVPYTAVPTYDQPPQE